MSDKHLKFDRANLIFAGIFTVFFGFLLVTGEPLYTNDTFQYENQMVMREPGYALLIQFLRFLSPEHHYQLIIILQNILAVAANTAFLAFMRRRFQLRLPMSLLFTAILLSPHIMTPLLSSSHLVLTNSLMTEGILFSLYPFAVMSLLDAMQSMEFLGKASIRTIVLFLILSLIRGQMMVLFVVWLIVMGGIAVMNACRDKQSSRNKKAVTIIGKCMVLLLLFTAAFVARTNLVRAYNYFENGLFVDTASGKAMSFANVLYVADREDGEAIRDEELRALFYEMYDTADADKMNYQYAPDGILKKAAYHEKCHDELNFTYFAEPAKRYVGEKQGIYTDRYQELMIAIDKVAAELMAELMPQVIGRYALNYINVIALGFVRTVAYEYPVLAWYALFLYIAAIVLTILLWRKNHASMAAAFMAVVLLTIAGNVCATALMIQCISRYMIYNLPMFYMAGLLELKEFIKK
ncbi:MAG: hypothetical protein J6C19_00970 [Lachnospiraceae bacterium]|nr:hypothetical protein [Lachnospiraceae bacterium]